MLWKKALLLLVLFCVGTVGSAVGQTGAISGTVTDASSGETLPGANVQIVGTQRGASTDANGTFRIAGIEPGTYDIRASFIGYQRQTKEVEVEDGGTTEVSFALPTGGVSMDEMVVVGYGTQERDDLTGSISSVPTQDLEDTPVENAQEAIQGRVAGVTVTQ
ncbi:MAG TPA: carboxypeptidase-like regulatory domain-containing protein, partial [Salinibacter sp.]|nr:carboxypeptidase-like regulatory domain-containing protein [Salinibacter sp.]